MKTSIWTTNNKKSSQELYDYLNYLNSRHKDKEVDYELDIKKLKPVRSVSHNRYYRAILNAIAVQTGYTDDELHSFYKKEFNGKEIFGQVVGLSTSTMDSDDFDAYVKKVKSHGETSHNVVFLEPRDKYYSVWEKESKNRYNAMFNSI